MKAAKISFALLIILLGLQGCSGINEGQRAVDGVYYSPSQNHSEPSTTDKKGNQSGLENKENASEQKAENSKTYDNSGNSKNTSDNNDPAYDYYPKEQKAKEQKGRKDGEINEDYYDYKYSSRIRRFNSSCENFNYFDPFYNGPNYGYDPYYPYPGLTLSYGFRSNDYYNHHYRQYRNPNYHEWGYYNDPSYARGYRRGYRQGFHDGYQGYGYSPYYNQTTYGSFYGGGYYPDGEDKADKPNKRRGSTSKIYRENNENKAQDQTPGRIIRNNSENANSSNQKDQQNRNNQNYDYYQPQDNRSQDLNQRNRSPSYRRDSDERNESDPFRDNRDRYGNSRSEDRRGNLNRNERRNTNDNENRNRNTYDHNRSKDYNQSGSGNDNNKKRRPRR